jgi:perosamine synthetase
MEELAINGGAPVSDKLLGYGHQDISEADIQAVVDCLRSDYLTCGPATVAFEDAIKQTTGATFVTAVANGTAALHVACLAAGIKPGDEVIVSPITFAASANCVRYCGATPVFADIDAKTWNISPASIREKITDKTRAVVAVDFGGVHVDSDEIRKICDEFDLTFIEDAAHAIGTQRGGRTVGSIADITTFSFHPVKTVTTGEGGAVATNDPELGKMIELYAKHGITRKPELMREQPEGGWYYEQLVLGYNYRISDIEASLGVSQMKRLGEFGARRRELVAFYNEKFAQIPEVSFQIDPSPEGTVRHLYCLKFDTEALGTTRRFIFDALRAEGIGTNVHYLPVYLLPYYKDLGHGRGECLNAEDYYDHCVTLPLHCKLTDEDAQLVVDAVTKVVEWCRANKGAK